MSRDTKPSTSLGMRPGLRWALLVAACAAAVVALLPEDKGDVQVVGTVHARASPVPRTVAATAIAAATNAPVPSPAETRAGAPWPPLSRAAQAAWVPVPPPRVAAPASAVQVLAPEPAPSFPYQWIGQIDEAGQMRVFLADAQRIRAVTPGETMESGWRLDGVSASGLQLTWLATGAAVQVAPRP